MTYCYEYVDSMAQLFECTKCKKELFPIIQLPIHSAFWAKSVRQATAEQTPLETTRGSSPPPDSRLHELDIISKFSHSSTLLTKSLTLGRNDNIHMFLRAHLCKVQIGSCVLNKELQFMTSTLERGGGH